MKNRSLLFSIVLIGGLSTIPTALYGRSESPDKQTPYEQALDHYAGKEFGKALKLLNKVIPTLKGTQQESTALFYQAYCCFHKRQYLISASHFKHFQDTFPRDDRAEEAMYMQGYALYLATPDVKLEQTKTHKALRILRTYLREYPEGKFYSQAKNCVVLLRDKLAEKAWLTAKLYYDLRHYGASVITLENFQADFPDASLNEQVAYLKVMAQQHCLPKKQKAVSVDEIVEDDSIEEEGYEKAEEEDKEVKEEENAEEVEEEVQKFVQYCREFLEQYPESSHTKDVEQAYNKVHNQ